MEKLRIVLASEYSYTVSIWIFNERKQLIYSPDDQKGCCREYDLTPGAYIIRIGVNGQTKDNQIDFPQQKNFDLGFPNSENPLEAPKLYSSALIAGNVNYESSHEYYLTPAIEISKIKSTFKSRYRIKSSGIFIFLRFPDKHFYQNGDYTRKYWKEFTITDRKGNFVVQFPHGCVTDGDKEHIYNQNNDSGYLGFNANLKPGLYFLNYYGSDKRSIPIYVYENWFTQFFMTVAKTPLFGSIRIFISKTKEYDPKDENHIYIDHCLNKIQNGDFTLDKELLLNIAYNKFDSPMLGLLGTYIYLSGKETNDNDLFEAIVYNLQEKILKNSSRSPDLLAVNLLCYRHLNKKADIDQRVTIKGTPMLRIAYDTIRKAAIDLPRLIPENSLNDHIAENQAFDSPFNTFIPYTSKYNSVYKAIIPILKYTQKPYNKLLRKASKVSSYKHLFTSYLRSINPFGHTKDKAPANVSVKKSLDINIGKLNEEPSIAHLDLTAYPNLTNEDLMTKSSADHSNGGWIASFIANSISEGKNLSSREIAEQFSLPLNTVLRVRREMPEVKDQGEDPAAL